MTVTTTRDSAWSAENCQETLAELRSQYPRYTDNELYAIWCHLNGRIPKDEDGKLMLDTWRMHAAEDGRHVQEGGFSVTPAMYGRALKAQPGVPKPRQQTRRKEEAPAPEPAAARPRGAARLSDRALAWAREFDRVTAQVEELARLQEQMDQVLDRLHGCRRSILEDLAEERPEVRPLLEEAGLL